MPDHHVGDPHGPLDQRRQLVALFDVLPPAGLSPPAALRLCAHCLGDFGDLLVGVGLDLDVVVFAPALVGLALHRTAVGADHQPVLGRQHRTLGGEHLGGPLMHGASSKLTCLVVNADQGVAPGYPHSRSQRRPPLPIAARVIGVGPLERIAFEQRLGVGIELVDLVLPDEGVAPVHIGRRNRPSPHRARPVFGIAPQRVVVAISLRYLAKRISIGLPIPRRLRMRLGDPDPSPQPGNGLIGNRPCFPATSWDCT